MNQLSSENKIYFFYGMYKVIHIGTAWWEWKERKRLENTTVCDVMEVWKQIFRASGVVQTCCAVLFVRFLRTNPHNTDSLLIFYLDTLFRCCVCGKWGFIFCVQVLPDLPYCRPVVWSTWITLVIGGWVPYVPNQVVKLDVFSCAFFKCKRSAINQHNFA